MKFDEFPWTGCFPVITIVTKPNEVPKTDDVINCDVYYVVNS